MESGIGVVLLHTEVPAELAGRGIGSRPAAGTFKLLSAPGRKAILKCPFMARFFARHPEYAGVVEG
jgi:predicted GNAT family acetyltransferase